MVARPDRRPACVVLGLPAPGQPVAGGARRRRAVAAGRRAPGRRRARPDRGRSTRSPTAPTSSRRPTGGASRATSATQAGWSSSTPAPPACWTPDHRSMLDDERDGVARRASCRAAFDHLLIGTSLPFLLAPGLHHLEALNEALRRGRVGQAAPRGSARSCGRPSTWSTGRRSRTASATWPAMVLEVADGGRGQGPARRSRSSPATCTTPTSPRSPERPATPAAADRAGRLLADPQPAAAGHAHGHRLHVLRRRRPGRPLRVAAGAAAKVPDPPLEWRLAKGPGSTTTSPSSRFPAMG